MRYGSLFSGVGGFDLGLDRAGMGCAWQVEADRSCRTVLRRHWREVPKHDDVCTVGASKLAPVDLICGGFPCQDVSVAGRRAGLAGERSGLFYELARIAAELTPRWLLIENVPGLLSQDGWRAMGTVLGALAQLGYWFTYRVLDSQYDRVAQRRRRVFIVGSLGDGRSSQVLLEPESLPGNPAPGREAGARVAASLTRGADSGGRGGYAGRRQEDDAHSGRIDGDSETFVAHPLRAQAQASHRADSETYVAHTLRAVGHDASEDGTGRGVPVVAQCHGSNVGPMGSLRVGNGNETGGVPFVAFNATQDPISGPISGALSGEGAACAGSRGVRRLTPRECERLQGFPDDWTQWGIDERGTEVRLKDGPRYRMMGNAVTVNVAEWIARRIVSRERAEAAA